MKDELPRGVFLAGRVAVTATQGEAGPLSYAFGDGSVHWRGALAPDSTLQFEIPVRAGLCYGSEPKTIRNTVRVQPGSGSVIEKSADVSVQCRTLTIGDFDITAEIVDGDVVENATDTQEPHGWQPGQPLFVKFTLKNNGSEPGHLALSLNFEEIKAAGSVDAATLSFRRRFRGPIVLVGPGATESKILTIENVDSWVGCLTCTVAAAGIDTVSTVEPFPDSEQELNFEAEACLVDDGEGRCPDDAGSDQVRRIPLRVRWFTQDLGDAPDSSNHLGAGMTAYTGVPAHYPTVFDPATGAEQGPRHYHPRPFHLGPLVSWEGEADRGPDADVVNNLRPPADVANLDRFDDGANPPTWTLQNCRMTEVPIQVFISPALVDFFEKQNQQEGYINIWLDANRDGDWADGVDCPTEDNQPSGPALEHVVIDFPVDVATLGAGLHTVRVKTGRVPWPADLAERPAWVRVTLSERESNKPLNFGGVDYGDGRGYDKPFRFGETEDYLWHPADNPGGVDVVDRQTRQALPDVGRGQRRGRDAHRLGHRVSQPRRSARRERDPARQTGGRAEHHRYPGRALRLPDGVSRGADENGDTLVVNIGTLPPGAGGRIVIITEAADDVASLKNKVSIHADGDVNEENNTATAEVTLGLHPPRILSPVSGATCSGDITVSGRGTARRHGRTLRQRRLVEYSDGGRKRTLVGRFDSGRRGGLYRVGGRQEERQDQRTVCAGGDQGQFVAGLESHQPDLHRPARPCPPPGGRRRLPGPGRLDAATAAQHDLHGERADLL